MMLGANFLFASLDTSVKWMLGLGFASLQLAFLRYVGHFVITMGQIVAGSGRPWRESRGQTGLLLLRAAMLVASTAGNFFALIYLPLTITSSIMFAAPILVCLLSVRLLNEPVGPWRWSAIALGFVGVLIVIQPFGEDFSWAAPLVVLNATSFALYSILTRKLAGRVSARVMQFYLGAFGTAVLAVPAWLTWQGTTSLLILAAWAALGAMGWLGHELLTRAHGLAEANILMPFGYSLLIYMTFFDIAVFGDVPTPQEWLGISIIVTAGLVIWKRGRT